MCYGENKTHVLDAINGEMAVWKNGIIFLNGPGILKNIKKTHWNDTILSIYVDDYSSSPVPDICSDVFSTSNFN